AGIHRANSQAEGWIPAFAGNADPFMSGVASRLGLPLWHPAALIATVGGIGLLPAMPGTWGSLAALPCAWAISALAGGAALAAAAILAFALGCWATAAVAQASGAEDPGFIVVDEVAAQWLVLVAAPLDWRAYRAARQPAPAIVPPPR